MKMLTVVLAICMLNIISCSNDNDAEIAELKNQIQELQQAQTAVVATTPSPATVTSTPISLPELGVKVEYSDKVKLWGENCTNDPFYGTVEIPIIDYFNNLEAKSRDVSRNETYSFRDGDKVARNGPFTTWYFEMFLQDVSSNVPEKFESISFGSHPEYFWEDYVNYVVTVCETFHGRDTLRNAVLAHSKLMNWRTDWPGHASKWESFPYIETGREVIKAPSPSGLEHYTKYITASGVIIVGGEKVPARAMLAAYDRVNYMLSARPEFHDILKENNVRISLFGPGSESTAGELPEFEGENEPGGFSMGVTDAAMTANVEWLCYPGNPDRGGDPVMHELVHTLNGIVFEQINELYFYERIYDLALSAIDKGIFATNYTQHLDDGEQQGMKHYVGEYWAMTVEGYLMDMEGFKNSHDTHEWIKENDPELYDLIIRYFPTQKWDLCTGKLKK